MGARARGKLINPIAPDEIAFLIYTFLRYHAKSLLSTRTSSTTGIFFPTADIKKIGNFH